MYHMEEKVTTMRDELDLCSRLWTGVGCLSWSADIMKVETGELERLVSLGGISTVKSLVFSNRGNRLSGWRIDLFSLATVNFQISNILWLSVFLLFCFFCFHSFLLKWNWSWGGDSDRWLSALTLYPIRRRFHPIKNHLCTLKLNGSQAAERKGLPCVSELRKSNFLKAAAAVAGSEGSNSHDWPGPRLHTQFNPSQSAWHHINQPFISMPPTP